MTQLITSSSVQVLDLTVLTIPQFYYLSSLMYPVVVTDDLKMNPDTVTGRSNHSSDLGVYQFDQGLFSTSISEVRGTLKVALKVYSMKTENLTTSVKNVTGILRLLLVTGPSKTEPIMQSVVGISGTLRHLLIQYNRYKEEHLKQTVVGVTSSSSTVQGFSTSYISGGNTAYEYPVVARMAMRMALSSFSDIPMITSLTETTEAVEGYTLIFKDPLVEVDLHNVVLVFGKVKTQGNNEPTVTVNEFTTSAIDFEDGIVDRINTTIWNTGKISQDTVGGIHTEDTFNFYLDDMDTPLFTNVTLSALPALLEEYGIVLEDDGTSNDNIVERISTSITVNNIVVRDEIKRSTVESVSTDILVNNIVIKDEIRTTAIEEIAATIVVNNIVIV